MTKSVADQLPGEKTPVMSTNRDNVADSSLYTAATWQWAKLPCAEFVTPDNARGVFRIVNAYMRLYRWLNPQKFSLPHQLLHRHAVIDRLLADSGCHRVIEIACGFSPRGSHYSANPALDYTEMDLPAVIAAKRAQLEKTAEGRAVLARANFHLAPVDVLSLDTAALCSDGSALTIITEGLMMYFSREQQLQIWRDIAAVLARCGGEYLFDYIPLADEPPRSRLGACLHKLRVDVLGLQDDFAYDARDRQAVADDLRAAGFSEVDMVATGDVARAWQLPQAEVPTRTLVYRCRVNPTHFAEGCCA